MLALESAPRPPERSPQAEITGSAPIQATDGLKGVSAVFFADRLEAGVETLRTDAARASVVTQIAALVPFDLGQAVAPRTVFLAGTNALATLLAIAARGGDAHDGAPVVHVEVRFARTSSDESSPAPFGFVGLTLDPTLPSAVAPGGSLVIACQTRWLRALRATLVRGRRVVRRVLVCLSRCATVAVSAATRDQDRSQTERPDAANQNWFHDAPPFIDRSRFSVDLDR
jgi:hypothetical protein